MVSTWVLLVAGSLARYEYTQVHMGIQVRLVLYARSREQAQAAGRAAFGRFAELEAIMSDYRQDSELTRLNETGMLESASPDLIRVLRQARRVSALSEGAFDVTAGPLVRLWRQTRDSGRLPTPETQSEARRRVGWRSIVIDPARRTVRLTQPGARIDLGGIAKGDACDQALAAMFSVGVTRALVEAGGDLAVGDPPPGASGWKVTIRNRSDVLHLTRQAVSTSGDAEQFVIVDGVRYSHIVDPRTGLGSTRRLQATVVAPSGLISDPLATAACLVPEKVQNLPGIRVYLTPEK